jgi:ELWxxDGT repeat protein
MKLKPLLIIFLLIFSRLNYAQPVYSLIAQKLIDFPVQGLQAERMHPIGNKLLIYTRVNNSNTNFQIHCHDLVTGTTVKIADDINSPDNLPGFPGFSRYENLNGKYITAPALRIPGGNNTDREPYITDGTPGGTQVLVDLYPNTGNSYPSSNPTTFTTFQNHIVFSANTGSSSAGLFKYDGVNPPMVISGQHYMNQAVVANNQLYYLGKAAGISGLAKLSSVNSQPVLLGQFSNVYGLAALGNKVIFYGDKLGSGVGYELYISDGTMAGTSLLKDLVPGSGSPIKPTEYITNNGNTPMFVELNGKAYFSFRDPNNNKSYLYQTDGTTAGTVMLAENTTILNNVFRLGDKIVFNAFNATQNKTFTYFTIGGPPALLTDDAGGYYTLGPTSIHGFLGYSTDRKIVSSGNYHINGSTNFSKLIVSNGNSSGTMAIDVSTSSGFVPVGSMDDFTFIGNIIYFLYNNTVFKLNLSDLITSVDNFSADTGVRIFPNPANTQLTIDYGNFSSLSGYTLKIVNALGQTVFTEPINQQTSYINVSTWTGSGIYYVQLINPQNNTIENRKIVIQ